MHIAKDTTGTLIVRGYGWQRFTAALLFLLSTPFWVWLALKVDIENAEKLTVAALILAVYVPFKTFLTVNKRYKDWLLVFEAEYDLVGFYEHRWIGRRMTERLALSEVANAKLCKKARTTTDKYGTEHTHYSYHLTLSTHTSTKPRAVAEGDEGDIYRMQSRINGWLESYRRRMLAQSKQSTSVT